MEKFTSYSWIDSDEALNKLLDNWENCGVASIAVDFEGEFNLHIYGEHLCLVQIYDGKDFYLIDPFLVSSEGLKRLFENPKLEKLWFACASDANLLWKKYKICLTGVYDLAVEQEILGLKGNLVSLEAMFNLNNPQETNKKKNQKSNWLIRPLPQEQIEYALSDVAYLFEIRKNLDIMANEAGKMNDVLAAMKNAVNIKTEYTPGYTKLPGYRRMRNAQKVRVKHFFQAREKLAEDLNKPPFQILDKHILVSLSAKTLLNKSMLYNLINNRNFSIKKRLITSLLEAQKEAVAEIERENRK
jgi:ribonuclease D